MGEVLGSRELTYYRSSQEVAARASLAVAAVLQEVPGVELQDVIYPGSELTQADMIQSSEQAA